MGLKTRIIPTMLVKGFELVKGSRFVNERVVGNAISACRIHNMRGVDELCLLEVGGQMIDLEVVKLLAGECFMPLAVGGGVRTLKQFGALIANGADKVVLGTVAFELPQLVRAAADKFGAQAVVVSIAVPALGYNTVAAAKYCKRVGAGEILLQSVERDGTLSGYDLDLIAAVSHAVSIPVIASGGCGTYEHMAQALRAGAHAVAAGAMFQFTDQTPQGAAKFLANCGFSTRVAA
jgi:cyclase